MWVQVCVLPIRVFPLHEGRIRYSYNQIFLNVLKWAYCTFAHETYDRPINFLLLSQIFPLWKLIWYSSYLIIKHFFFFFRRFFSCFFQSRLHKKNFNARVGEVSLSFSLYRSWVGRKKGERCAGIQENNRLKNLFCLITMPDTWETEHLLITRWSEKGAGGNPIGGGSSWKEAKWTISRHESARTTPMSSISSGVMARIRAGNI